MNNLPPAFLVRLKKQFPGLVQDILKTFLRRPPVIRVNTLVTTPKKMRTELEREGIMVEEIPELRESFRILNADRKRITDLTAYLDGRIYLQSVASQLVVKALDPEPGEKILDLCAAPGSKTSQIAILMKSEGELVANEPKRERFFRLTANLRQQKLDQFVITKQYQGERYGDHYPEHFDKVLVDAPCSSETRFVPEDIKTTRYWSRHKVKAFARLQRKLMESAIHSTKPGGLIAYSTCTFSPEENELIIDRVLRKHPDITLQTIPLKTKSLPITMEWNGKKLDGSLRKALRLFPDELHEGFFIALLRKRKPTV